jgi:hypothetical protein
MRLGKEEAGALTVAEHLHHVVPPVIALAAVYRPLGKYGLEDRVRSAVADVLFWPFHSNQSAQLCQIRRIAASRIEFHLGCWRQQPVLRAERQGALRRLPETAL